MLLRQLIDAAQNTSSSPKKPLRTVKKQRNIFKELFLPSSNKALPMSKGGPMGMGKAGFIAPELAQFAYAAVTVILILFTWTNIADPMALLCQRVTFISGTLALWLVYFLWPCRFVMLLRIAYLLLILGSWYPDTYELNKGFGCLDHLFANYEQMLFGMQPALLFSERFASQIVSEAMYFGYVSYYLFFVVTTAIIFFRDYKQLERATFIIFGGFFICYTIYIVLPVTGPQYYFHAVGTDAIAAGNFPDIALHFKTTTESLPMPGWNGGIFYKLCHLCHQTGERPTAAFPSSHVAIATVVMLIVARMRMWNWLLLLATPFIFLCLSTVYIQAHYAIDAIAGLLFGIILFFSLGGWKLK